MAHMLFTVWRHRHSCEVVLVDTFSTQAFWFAYVVAKLCELLKIPFIPVVRGGDFLKRLAVSKEKCDFLFTKSHKNIVPSKFLEFHFSQAGYPVTYIPNFIELQKYPFRQREQLHPKLLWVRSFHRIYNPLLAVEVVHRLNWLEANLCMVGGDSDGTRAHVDERIRALGLGDKVVLPGRLLKKDWISLASQYDIFINTTTIDNMPVSVIEAMALGLPLVSTNVGGIPFLIDHGVNGLLVPSNDPDAMVEAIKKLLTSPEEARQMVLNARRMVEQFDWEHVKLMWFDVLDRIATKRHG